MTDSLDSTLEDPAPPLAPGTGPDEPQGMKPCAEEGCTDWVPFGSHMARKYCETHFVGGAKARKGRRGESPPQVVVNLGNKGKPSSKDKTAADTAAGATAFMKLIATGVSLTGDAVCATAVNNGADAWGQAMGELARYQPAIAKLFAPAGEESQFGAWLGVVLATATIAIPVMAHHEVLPASIAAKMGGVFVAAADVGNTPGDAAHAA